MLLAQAALCRAAAAEGVFCGKQQCGAGLIGGPTPFATCRKLGWTRKNEITNGRWVMFGILVGMLTEYATGEALLTPGVHEHGAPTRAVQRGLCTCMSSEASFGHRRCIVQMLPTVPLPFNPASCCARRRELPGADQDHGGVPGADRHRLKWLSSGHAAGAACGADGLVPPESDGRPSRVEKNCCLLNVTLSSNLVTTNFGACPCSVLFLNARPSWRWGASEAGAGSAIAAAALFP